MQICIPSVTHARLVALAVPLLLAAGIPSRAFATPIVIYDEAVDGDLSGRFGTTLSLNPGTNAINGTVTFTNNQSVPVDFDSFVFASADLVESMTLAIALLPVGSGVFDNVSLGLFDSVSHVATHPGPRGHPFDWRKPLQRFSPATAWRGWIRLYRARR